VAGVSSTECTPIPATQLRHQSCVGAAQPLRVDALILRGERVPERADQRAEPRQVGGQGPAWRGGRRAARQLERPAVLHAITVIIVSPGPDDDLKPRGAIAQAAAHSHLPRVWRLVTYPYS